jgi:hypothetical protein
MQATKAKEDALHNSDGGDGSTPVPGGKPKSRAGGGNFTLPAL